MAEKIWFGLYTERYCLHAKWPGLLPKLRRLGELDDRTAMGRGLDGQRYGVALKVVNRIIVAKFELRFEDNIDFGEGCGLESQTPPWPGPEDSLGHRRHCLDSLCFEGADHQHSKCR